MIVIDVKELTDIVKSELGAILISGGLGAWKTDTVYGLFCRFDAINTIDRIFELKGRPVSRKMSIVIDDFKRYRNWFDVNQNQEKIIYMTLPGPYTYILDLKEKLYDTWFSGEENVGIRIPDDQLTLQLCKFADKPLVATSANKSGKEEAREISEVPGFHDKKLDFIIDSGQITNPIASTVIKFSGNGYSFLREGKVKKTEFEEIWQICQGEFNL